MRRFSLFLWMPAIVVALFLLYQVKYEVQSLKNQVAETARQLEAEKELLHVSAAEWAYLNRPERLQELAEKYLGASDVTVNQVADVRAIAFPTQQVASAHEQITSAAVYTDKE